MSINKSALRRLFDKGSDADLLREMIGFVAERLRARDLEDVATSATASASRHGPTSANCFRERP